MRIHSWVAPWPRRPRVSARWTPSSVLTGGSDVLPAQMALAVLHIRRYGRSAKRSRVEVSVADSGVTPGFDRRLRRFALRLAIGAGLAALAWLLSSAVSAGTASAAQNPQGAAPTNSAPSGGLLDG